MATTLPTRQLGRNGPTIPAMGFGAMGLSAFYGPPKSDEERFAVLDKALELGETFWDTADVYLDNEDLIGNWFKRTGKRDQIFLATKFAINRTGVGRTVRGDREYVFQACEKSLKRLGVDCIDLYYCHRVDSTIPVEETVQAMKELQQAGKIKHIGLSECSAASLRRASAVATISALQVEYSPFFIGIETEAAGILETARELGIAIVAYSPLGRGLLTGKYKSIDDFAPDDWRRNVPRYQGENFKKNLQLVDRIVEIAARKRVTASQLTLAWVLRQGEDFFPIPGTTRIGNLEENIGALTVELTDDEEAEIRKAINACETVGDRYPEAAMATLFADTPEKS